MIWRRNRGDGEEITPVEARQGFLDRPVLLVLIVSVVLVTAIFSVMWLRLFG
jgi:hypothetical protein